MARGRPPTTHSAYLKKLRLGVTVVKVSNPEAQAARMRLDVAPTLAAAQAGHSQVVLEASAAALDEGAVPLWQQGDVTLQTRQKMDARASLRTDRKVRGSLQRLWECAQRSYGSDDPFGATTIAFEGYAAIMQEATFKEAVVGFKSDTGQLKRWLVELDRMRIAGTERNLHVDSKTLKNQLMPITTKGLDKCRGLLLQVARDRCVASLQEYQQRMRDLGEQPRSLRDFADYCDNVNKVRTRVGLTLTLSLSLPLPLTLTLTLTSPSPSLSPSPSPSPSP